MSLKVRSLRLSRMRRGFAPKDQQRQFSVQIGFAMCLTFERVCLLTRTAVRGWFRKSISGKMHSKHVASIKVNWKQRIG